jgi:hypothetical protein
MKENWYALCVSILTENSIQRALGIMNIKPDKLPQKKLHLTEQQALNLNFLRQTMTWNELSEEFGISGEALRMQVRKALKKATKNPDQSVQSSMHKNSPSLYHIEGGMQVVS